MTHNWLSVAVSSRPVRAVHSLTTGVLLLMSPSKPFLIRSTVSLPLLLTLTPKGFTTSRSILMLILWFSLQSLLHPQVEAFHSEHSDALNKVAQCKQLIAQAKHQQDSKLVQQKRAQQQYLLTEQLAALQVAGCPI